jgi:GABA(A) receptor-associated protein
MLKYWVNSTPVYPTSGFQFKMQHTFEKRLDESTRLKQKHPDKVPIILEKGGDMSLPSIDRHKFLMQRNITVGQFIFIIRSKTKLDHTQALFLIVDINHIPSTAMTIGELFDKYADKDGFLYIIYSAQQTFG